ncbi:MAG: right-handed parallel beta-helix repeat-containing protein [Terracidiphilus sp.]
MRIPLLLGISALLFAQSALAASFPEFVACVGASGKGAVCQLNAGTYAVRATIEVGRSNIVITGTETVSPLDTVLRRAAGFEGPLLTDVEKAGTTLNSITIENLTFDGNRAQNKSPYSDYAPDVSIFSVENLAFINCEFNNSPNIGLGLYGAGTAGVTVDRCAFNDPVIYGLWSDATGNNSNITYEQCATKRFVKNVTVANSTFQNSGEPAILGDMINLQIVNNVFTNNHSYSIPFDDDGGQIDLTVCTRNAVIWRNTFQSGAASPNGHVADGIELHGTNISLIDNIVKNNSGGGIFMDGAQHIYIANVDPTTGNFGNAQSGIEIAHSSSAFRLTEWITIDFGNGAGNDQYGIWSDTSNTTPKEPVNHLTIANSCLSEDKLGPTYLKNLGSDVKIQNNITSGCGPD